MRILAVAADHHRCDLPEADIPPGSIGQCEGCGLFYVYDPIPWERTWRRLRPWPFDAKARRRIDIIVGY